MHVLYNIGILFYGFGIRIASLFNTKAKDWIKGRKNLLANLPDTKNRQVVWFHCASLGEFDQGLPLMNKIKSERPDSYLLVTFFSPSGMNFQHKRKHQADHVMYIPLDTPSNARKFIQHFQPELAFFVKYEFWANVIFEAKKADAKIFNVSGLFREDHRFFKSTGGFFRKVLNQFNWFFVQNQKSVDLLNSINIKNASISGDSRFDRVLENKKNVEENELIKTFKGEHDLLIVGSSWPEDEKVLIPWIQKHDLKVLIAPHNVDEKHIGQICSALPEAKRFTTVEKTDLGEINVLILDTIGQLANAYSYGDIAYVGGGFSGSLHNILEPAVFGLPVIFGPKHSRFPEGQQFIEKGIGFSISNTAEFEKHLAHIRTNHEAISVETVQFVEQNRGAADRIWSHITSN